MLLLCFVYAGAIFPPELFHVVDDVGHADPCSSLRLSNAADEHSHGLFLHGEDTLYRYTVFRSGRLSAPDMRRHELASWLAIVDVALVAVFMQKGLVLF